MVSSKAHIDAISEAKPVNVSLNGIVTHLISCNKRRKTLMPILVNVMSQVLYCLFRIFLKSMSRFLSNNAVRELPLGEDY